MRKHLIALALALACLLGLVGCAGKPDETTSYEYKSFADETTSHEYKSFAFENVSKIVVTSIEGRKLEVTDVDTVQKITKNIASVQFEKGESSENYNGFGPFVDWYDTNGNYIEGISVMAGETIIYDGFFWTAMEGNIDYTALNELLDEL